MIKMLAHGDDVTLLVFGLSRGNIDRLIAGDPIRIKAGEMDSTLGDLQITIFFGETDQDMAKMVQANDLIGPDTKVRVDPRLAT